MLFSSCQNSLREHIFLGAEMLPVFLQKAHRLNHAGVPPKAWNLLFQNKAAWITNEAESSGWNVMGGKFQQSEIDMQLCESSSQHGGKRARAALLMCNNDATCDAQASPTRRPPRPVFEHGWKVSAVCN